MPDTTESPVHPTPLTDQETPAPYADINVPKPYEITDDEEIVPQWDPSTVSSDIVTKCREDTGALLDTVTSLMSEYRAQKGTSVLYLHIIGKPPVEMCNAGLLLAKIKSFFSWVKTEVKGSTVVRGEVASSNLGDYKRGIVFGVDSFSDVGITGDYVSTFGKNDLKDKAMGRGEFAPTAPALAKKRFRVAPLKEEMFTKGGLWDTSDLATLTLDIVVRLSAVSFEVHRLMSLYRLRAAVDVYIGEYPYTSGGNIWSVHPQMPAKIGKKVELALAASGFLHPESTKKGVEDEIARRYDGDTSKTGKAQRADEEKRAKSQWDVWLKNALGQVDTCVIDKCITGLMEFVGQDYVVTNAFKANSLTGFDMYDDMTVKGSACAYLTNPDTSANRNAATRAMWGVASKQHKLMLIAANTRDGKPTDDRYAQKNDMVTIDPMFDEFVETAINPKCNWIPVGPSHEKGVTLLDRKGAVVHGKHMEQEAITDGREAPTGNRPLNIRESMECMSALRQGLIVAEGGMRCGGGTKHSRFVWFNVESVQVCLHEDAMQCLSGWKSAEFFDWSDPYTDMRRIMCRRDAAKFVTIQIMKSEMTDVDAIYPPPTPPAGMMALCAPDNAADDADADGCNASATVDSKRRCLELTDGDVMGEFISHEAKRVCSESI